MTGTPNMIHTAEMINMPEMTDAPYFQYVQNDQYGKKSLICKNDR